MIRFCRLTPAISILSVVLLIGSSVLAANGNGPEKKPKVGKISAGPSTVEWSPQVDNERLLLSVSTPWGEVWSKEFPAGKNPTFRIHDIPGRVVDGTYTWELRVAPRIHPQVQKQMEALREAGDDAGLLRLRAEHGLDDENIESGGFTVVNGSIVSPDAVEQSSGFPGTPSALSAGGTSSVSSGPVKAMDQVIPDDLIVQSSVCVGFDCVNNEVFGFDTIRLKENNTRIKFEDTSAGSFPSTDWQLTANDSASGGQNKFSIEDVTAARVPFTVEANATTNSLYIDGTGRIGFRTSTPVLDLHVNTNNTPGMRLEQNNAGGFTAQTWDIAGNEANFFIRDVTGGSRLPFRIRPGAPTSSIDIAASGNVGIGTSSPTLHRLDANLTGAPGGMRAYVVNGSSTSGLELQPSQTVNRITSYDRGLSTYVPIVIQAGLTGLALSTNGALGLGGVVNAAHPIQHQSGAYLSAGGVWTDASSRELKQDISELDSAEAFDALGRLSPVKFAYTSDPGDGHVGFIAEDVPDIVATPDRKGLSSMDVVAVLTKVVQDQQKVIESLNQRLEELERDR